METCPTCEREFERIRQHWGASDCEIPESAYYECSHDGCTETFPWSRELTIHEEHHPKHRDSGELCHDCGHRYDRLSHHWTASDECEYPELTERQHNIIRGLMMGDGCSGYHESNANPNITVRCIVPEYLEYLSDEFGVLGSDVALVKTGAEKAAENRDSGFRPDARAENYSDQYCFNTMSTPEMWQYRDWYETGEKVWPDDLELTPETLTHWYVGDGNNSAVYPELRIGMSNEKENTEKVERYFERAGLPTPDRWDISETHCNACWRTDTSKELFEYMTGPLPGYEYKWPKSVR